MSPAPAGASMVFWDMTDPDVLPGTGDMGPDWRDGMSGAAEGSRPGGMVVSPAPAGASMVFWDARGWFAGMLSRPPASVEDRGGAGIGPEGSGAGGGGTSEAGMGAGTPIMVFAGLLPGLVSCRGAAEATSAGTVMPAGGVMCGSRSLDPQYIQKNSSP